MENRIEDVVKKTLSLFSQYGVKSVSMDDIARELAMSKKTLYSLISDKNSLVVSVIDYMHEIFKSSLLVFHDEQYNAIEQFFVMRQNMNDIYGNVQPAFVRDLHKYHPDISKSAISEKNEILEAAFHANLKQGIKEGLYHEDINYEIVSKILLLIHLHLLSPIQAGELDVETDDALGEEVFKYHFRAICTAKGMAELKKQKKNRTIKTPN